jgi:hypothetical protein
LEVATAAASWQRTFGGGVKMKKKSSSEVAGENAYLQEPLSNPMKTTHKPDLVIAVPCREGSPPAFVLEPPGRGGFRIVARCQGIRRAKAQGHHSWSSRFAAVVGSVVSMITHCFTKRQRERLSCHDV